MPNRTRRKIDASFALALLILFLVSAASVLSIREQRRDQEWLLHSEEELRLLEAVFSDLQDAQLGQRGFLITEQPRFLEPYQAATRELQGHLQQLRQRAAFEPDQLARQRRLEALAARQLTMLQRNIALAQEGDFEGARDMVRAGTGKARMDSIRAVVKEMRTRELQVREQRSAVLARSHDRTVWVVALGSILAVLVVGLARWRILGDLRGREEAETRLATSERSLRSLYQIASSQELDLDAKLLALLEMGRQRLGVENGVVARIEGDRYHIVQASSLSGGLQAGEVFPLEDTYCAMVYRGTDAVAVEHAAADLEWGGRRCYHVFGLETYIGVPLRVNDEPWGALCFSDPTPRGVRFSESEKDFLLLMSQWVGGEIERRQALDAVRQREERYRALVENANDIIFTTDRWGRFTYVNPVAVRTTGYSEQELIGMPFEELIRADYRDPTREFYESQWQQGATTSYYEFPVILKDGREIWMGQNVQLLRDGVRPTGMQAVARDITKQYEVERMKDEFLSVVSHELRTPLTAIRGSLGLLASGNLGALHERGQRMLEIAAQNTDRLVRLINDLLDIEKIESGKSTMERRTVSSEELLRQAVDVMAPMAEKSGVELVVRPVAADLWADPDRILQVLTNLISNAIKFSPTGSRVWVEAVRNGREMEIRVRDQGRGIPADKLDAVFERFQQVDSSDARQKGGTGLGLPIARSLVQQHGGRMWVESKWGEGSTFHFTLPVQPDEADEDLTRAQPLVLICDDDAGLCAALRQVLEHSGYRVLAASTGEEALQLASAEPPAAVLLDMVMPGMAGEDLIQALRQSEHTRDVPVVIFSALGAESGSPLLDAVEWLTKPTDAATLLGAVDRAVGRDGAHCDVMIVEDDDDVAQVMGEMFNRHGVQSCRARTGTEAIEMSARMTYDLLVLDLGLPDTDGFSVVDWLRRHDRLRSIPLLVYTARDLTEADRSRLRLGPTEFMTKSRVPIEQFERRAIQLMGRIVTGQTQTS